MQKQDEVQNKAVDEPVKTKDEDPSEAKVHLYVDAPPGWSARVNDFVTLKPGVNTVPARWVEKSKGAARKCGCVELSESVAKKLRG